MPEATEPAGRGTIRRYAPEIVLALLAATVFLGRLGAMELWGKREQRAVAEALDTLDGPNWLVRPHPVATSVGEAPPAALDHRLAHGRHRRGGARRWRGSPRRSRRWRWWGWFMGWDEGWPVGRRALRRG